MYLEYIYYCLSKTSMVDQLGDLLTRAKYPLPTQFWATFSNISGRPKDMQASTPEPFNFWLYFKYHNFMT